MYAIVKAGGRQLRVEPKQTVRVDRLAEAVGDGVEFTEVLAVHDGADLTVGTPCVANAKVLGRIVGHAKDRKIRVQTFRRKKRTQRSLGNRQALTLVQILDIEADQLAGVKAAAAADEPVEAPAPDAGEPTDDE